MPSGTWQALVAKLCLWLCLWGHGGSSGCSHTRLAYSIHFSHDAKPARGIHVSYDGSRTLVLQHSCEGHGPGGEEPKAAMYPGKEVFISLNTFESSLSPLPMPKELEAKEATVGSIGFVHKDRVSMVVNSQVYMYFKSIDRWDPISRSHVPCVRTLKHPLLLCGSRPPVQGAQLAPFWLHQALCLCQPHLPFIGWSYTFTHNETSTREQGALLSLYNFTSFAVTGLLTDRSGEDEAGKAAGAYVRYNGTKTSHMSSHSSTTFHLLPKGPANLYSIQNLALRGFIILWTTDALLLSANNCLIMEEVTVVPLVTFQSTTFPNSGFLLVTVSSSQIAVLTQDRHLFYSSISQVTHMVYIAEDERIDLKNTGISFEERGWPTLLSPVISNFTQLYDFNKCKLNLQYAVWRSQQSCTVQILSGDFRNKICYIDMHENLTLRAIFVPKPGKRSTPLVTVSSPHVLAFSADVIEVELTYGGNTEYFLHVVPEQQHFAEVSVLKFCNGIGDGERSTVTMDIPDNPIGCTDVASLIALVAVSCPPAKHIRIVKNVTVCDEGLIQEAALRIPVVQSAITYTTRTFLLKKICSRTIYRPNITLQIFDVVFWYIIKILGCQFLSYRKAIDFRSMSLLNSFCLK